MPLGRVVLVLIGLTVGTFGLVHLLSAPARRSVQEPPAVRPPEEGNGGGAPVPREEPARGAEPSPPPDSERTGAAGPERSSARFTVFGRLVDDATDQPLDEVDVSIDGGGRARTGPGGEFRFEGAPGAARITAAYPDGRDFPVRRARRVLRADGEPLELRAKVGPRYRVELVGPRDAPDEGWRGQLVVHRAGWLHGHALTDQAPFRRAPRARLRFARRPDGFPVEEVRLVVTEPSGVWRGEAAVPALEGESHDVLQVVLRKAGVVVGRLVEEGGLPVAGATVQLRPAAALPFPAPMGGWRRERTGDDGHFRFEDVLTGETDVLVAPPFRPVVHRRFHAGGGLTDLGEILVPALGPTGVVSGALTSASGTEGVSAMLHLESLDGSGWARSWFGPPSPLFPLFFPGGAAVDDPRAHVPFQFEDVPAGRYRLTVVPWDGWPYEPASLELEAPREDLEIRRLDAGGGFGFGFAPVDAGTGAPIEEYRAHFQVGDWSRDESYEHRSGAVLGRIHAGGGLSWSVSTPGRAPVFGTAADFAALAGDPRILTVPLEVGWGAELQVRDGRDPRRFLHESSSAIALPAPGSRPLAGVRVLADGEPVATTDPDGKARLRLDSSPRRIDLVLPGWQVLPTRTFAEGRVLLGCPHPKALMVPVE